MAFCISPFLFRQLHLIFKQTYVLQYPLHLTLKGAYMLQYPFICVHCNVDIWYDFEDEVWLHYENQSEACGSFSQNILVKGLYSIATPRRKKQLDAV